MGHSLTQFCRTSPPSLLQKLATRMGSWLRSLGTLDEFEPTTETVSNYVERMQMFFVANDIAEAKQVSTFLTAVGKKAYAVLKDLLSPDKPSDKTLEDLVSVLGSCQIYGSTEQLAGGVVTSHLVALELIHTAEAYTPSRPHALTSDVTSVEISGKFFSG